jgi:hypothetical protein
MIHTRYLALPHAALLVAALTLTACDDGPAAPSSADTVDLHTGAHALQQPLQLDFEKCVIDRVAGIWEGQVTGDITGDLRTELRELTVTGEIWQVRFDWIVTAGAQSFIADLTGVLNLNTGGVVMNGTVADGYLTGASVHEAGQLVDPVNLCFTGTIQIKSATAD